jgi:uncharacterized protein with von Willebrand factor type A (vWA) domain
MTMKRRKRDPLVDTHLCQPPRHDDAAPRTYAADYKGRKVQVTVPESDEDVGDGNLLHAAENLLAAKDNQMETVAEWRALRREVRKARKSTARTREQASSPDSHDLGEALRDSLSPEGVAAIAAHLQALHPSKNKSADRQVVWFHDLLVGLLGDDEYNRLCDELGF